LDAVIIKLAEWRRKKAGVEEDTQETQLQQLKLKLENMQRR